eukprot:TRINITY_DN5042_c0_g1_i2.p2 TRINITY_DN5042_c0_g1~~TRINITY_DN5042_c0_g1_i2.p2  ORF type:complete len:106 (-),score=26.68 TRINITY_DN5042_c0_g1_i2:117-434(-)
MGNLVEVGIMIVILAMAAKTRADPKVTLLSFMVSVMTLHKTIVYFFTEFASGLKYTHWDDAKLIFWFLVPNGIWIVVPCIIVYTLGRNVLAALPKATSVAAKKTT